MTLETSRFASCLVLLALPVIVHAAPAEKWLHVRVSQSGDRPEIVRVNLPLTLVESLLPAIRQEKLQGGKLRVDGMKLDGADLKAIVEAVRSSRDGEFVTVEGGEDDVRVGKSGDTLFVRVKESGEEHGTVDVRVPLSVAEALFASEPDTLDLGAMIKALRERGEGEIVTIKDRKSDVRIWIDTRAAAD